MSELTIAATVDDLEALLSSREQQELPADNALINGLYSRTIYIPAGCCLTGAQHKTDHLNIVFGDITVTTDDGVKRLTGFHVLPTKAGQKRAGYAHNYTIWTTICRTEFESLDDLYKIENELVEDAGRLQRRSLLESQEQNRIS